MREQRENLRIIKGLDEFISDLSGKNPRSNYFFQGDGNNSYQHFWFRGVRNHKFSLSPRIYRKLNHFDNNSFWSELKDKEEDIHEEFSRRCYHLIKDFYPENKFMWLSMMQHYGMATRLLDWTEEAIPAFFFALEKYFIGEEVDDNDLPCVWVLKPEVMNVEVSKNILSLSEEEIDINNLNKINNIMKLDPSLSEDKDKTDITKRAEFHNKAPFSVTSPYNTERIKAQAGTFVLFPKESSDRKASKEKFYLENLPNNEKFLFKYIICNPYAFTQKLKQIGVKRSLYYPEIPSLSPEIEEMIFLKSSLVSK